MRYDGARDEMRDRIPKHLSHVLPSAAQITQVTGTWDVALAIAGLQSREPDRVGGGVPAADMIRAFVRANGAWPTKRALEQFGQDVGVRWRRPHQDGVILRDVVSDVHVEMTASGDTPPALTERWGTDRGRPRIDLNAAEFTAAPTATEGWTRETVLGAVAEWLRARDGREVTWRAYMAEAAGNPLMPQGSTITRLGGWADVRKHAGKVR